jgi:ABC-type lipoprotein export system ATPase subunit
MVTHDSRILDIADRIVRIEDGRLLDRPLQEMNRAAEVIHCQEKYDR